MEKLELLPQVKSTSQVLVTVFPENPVESLKIARVLREADIRTEVYLGQNSKLNAQLKYANKLGVPIAVLTFPDQIANGIYIVKNMLSEKPEQFEVSTGELTATIRKILST